MVRLGNFLDVSNGVFMHIIGTAEVVYKTVENYDFENRVRDRVTSRNPSDTSTHEAESDATLARLRFGIEVKYQQNLSLHLLFDQRQIFDGNIIDDRANSTNPSVQNAFNQRIGIVSHVGISTAYSNPGTLLIPVGLKAYPAKGHELVGWYVYRGMVNTNLLEVAFAPELAGKGTRTGR